MLKRKSGGTPGDVSDKTTQDSIPALWKKTEAEAPKP